MGDDFANILHSNFGLRPSGKAAPMSNTKASLAPKQPADASSNGRSGSGISSFGGRPAPTPGPPKGTGPSLDIPDNFGAVPPPRPPAGIFDAPRDIFADLSQAAGSSSPPAQTVSGDTGYDKLFGDVGRAPPAAGDDIFGGLGGPGAANTDVFGMGSPSGGVKVDDLLGNLGGMAGARGQKPPAEDDILGGLGAPARSPAKTRVPDLYSDADPLKDFSSASADPFGGFPGATTSNGAPKLAAEAAFDDWGMPAPAVSKPVSSQNRPNVKEAKPAECAPPKAEGALPKRAAETGRSTTKPPSRQDDTDSVPVAPVSAGPVYLTVDQIVLKTKPTKASPPLRMPPSKLGERQPSTEARRPQPPPPSYKEAQQARASSSQPADPIPRSSSAPRATSSHTPQSQGSGSFFSGFSRTSNSARSSEGDKSSQGTPRASGESTPTFEDSDTKGAASAASASAAAMAAALERAQAKHRASYERKQREEREQAKQQASSEAARQANKAQAPPRPAAKPAPQPQPQTTDFFNAPPRRPSRTAEPDLMNNNHDAPKSYSSVEDLFGAGSRRTSAADDLAGSKQKPSSRSANDLSGLQADWGSAFGVQDPEADAGIEPGDNEERRKAKLAKAERLKERADAALRAKQAVDTKQASEADERHRCDELYGAEIKRWASGKEGNLRALLSTLQFVLWPECDWKPVQMTDLITGNNVKKVYQRAILKVHPDKVQQKGATIHQKYIAGKVFDLLKEAYNKFNSTELF